MGLNSTWVSLTAFATTACWHRASNLLRLRSKTWTWKEMSNGRDLCSSVWVWLGEEWSRKVARSMLGGGGRTESNDSVRFQAECFLRFINCCQSFCAAALHMLLWRLVLCREGKEASPKGWETDHLVRGGAPPALVCTCFCQPGHQPAKMILFSILISVSDKWVHVKAQLTPPTAQVTKAGSSGSYFTDAPFHSTKLWLIVCFWKRDHCIHYLKYISFWKCSSMMRIIHDEDSYVWSTQPPIWLYIVLSKSIK